MAVSVLGACGGPQADRGAGPAPEAAPTSWERVIAPVPVIGEDGEPVAHPFLGGFDVPRPQLVDIDGDGDLDLFIQERSNALMHFENVGTPAAAQWVWRSDRFADLAIHEWYRFVDMDADGDMDLLAEEPFSYIRYYRNDGTPGHPRFVLAADTVRTVDGLPIPSDRQNIPNATDIDCDGLTDLFIGKLTGTVTRYEAVEVAPVPVFELVTDRFEDIEIVANQVGVPQRPSMRHGANTMDFADYDGDGDQDLFWGDFFEAGLLLLENQGTCRSPAISNRPVPFPRDEPVQTTGYNAPTVGDLNGDGRPDMVMGVLGGAYNPTRSAGDNLYYLEQGADGYEVQTRRYLPQIDLGSESAPVWIDDDGDGDLDLLVGTKIDPGATGTGRIYRFENTGDTPALRWRGPLAIEGAYHYAPESGDLDGDGRSDLVIGTWNDDVLYYRNTGRAGDARWALEAEPLVELTRGSHSVPALGDVDGDGDLDLVVGEASGTLNYYRNTGSPSAPRFELVSDEWLDLDVGRRSHPELIDLDGDGDLDLVVGNEAGELAVFLNDGRGSRFRPGRPLGPTEPFAAPTFVDLDGDGRHALVLGGLSGGLVYYRPGS